MVPAPLRPRIRGRVHGPGRWSSAAIRLVSWRPPSAGRPDRGRPASPAVPSSLNRLIQRRTAAGWQSSSSAIWDGTNRAPATGSFPLGPRMRYHADKPEPELEVPNACPGPGQRLPAETESAGVHGHKYGSGAIVVTGSVGEQDAFAEQVGFGASVHLSFD